MYLKINDQMTVEEVEDRFNECFPYLRIAFYSRPHKKFEPTDKQFRYHGYMKLEDIRTKHTNLAIEIKSWFTVSMVESMLKHEFGLNAQVFRSEGEGNFIQTTLSDSLTLHQQSELSMNAESKKQAAQ